MIVNEGEDSPYYTLGAFIILIGNEMMNSLMVTNLLFLYSTSLLITFKFKIQKTMGISLVKIFFFFKKEYENSLSL